MKPKHTNLAIAAAAGFLASKITEWYERPCFNPHFATARTRIREIELSVRICSKNDEKTGGLVVTAYKPSHLDGYAGVTSIEPITSRLAPGWTWKQVVKRVSLVWSRAYDEYLLDHERKNLFDRCAELRAKGKIDAEEVERREKETGHDSAFKQMDKAALDYWAGYLAGLE